MVTIRNYVKDCNDTRLIDELIAAGEILTPALGFTFYTVTVDHVAPLTQIFVIDTLSGADATIIDNVVAAHVNTPYPSQSAGDVAFPNGDTALIPGNVMYLDVNTNTVKKASATSSTTSAVLGLSSRLADTLITGATAEIRYYDTLTLTTAQWDTVFGTSGGLTPSASYYLSTTPGKGTAIAPSTPYVVELGVAISNTTLMIRIKTGAAGPAGPTGPAVFLEAEQGDEGMIGPPGPMGPAGASGGGGNTGTAIIDFGAFPGTTQASVAVTGQSSILNTSLPQAFIKLTISPDHSADEHMIEGLKITTGNVVAGTGFTIYAELYQPVPAKVNFTYGKWNVSWEWN